MTRTIYHEKCYLDIDPYGKKTFRMQDNRNICFSLTPLYEFALQIENGDYSEIVTSELCEKKYRDTETTLCTVYSHEAFDMTVAYRFDRTAVNKTLTLTAKKDFIIKYAQTEISKTTACLSRGGEGQPIFLAEDAFISIVFPAAQNYIDCDTIRLEQAPFIQLTQGETIEFFDVVFGFHTAETLEASFLEYIDAHKKKTPSGLRIYCDWGAHDELAGENELDESLALAMLDRLQIAGKCGVDFDYYLMDAFWFKKDGQYQEFNSKTWPDGISGFRERLRQMGLRFGLWFDVNMGYLTLPEELPKRDQDNRTVCLGYDDTVKILFDGIKKQLKDSDCTLLKLDFAFFDCDNETHSVHASGGVKSKEPSIRNFLQGLQSLQETNEKLLVIGYNGFTTDMKYINSLDPNHSGYAVSPWWCLYMDYIYCGDPRPSELPAENLSTSLIFYTDSMIELFGESLVPYQAIDDHGTMVGNTNTIYYLGKETFPDSWIMNLSRGGKKEHLYGDIGLFGEKDWKFIEKSNAMFSFICDPKNRTERIAGSPLRGEAYGYSNSDGEKGYVTLVNCENTDKNLCIRLKDWAESETIRIRKYYADQAFVQEAPEEAAEAVCVKLKPGEVIVYQWEKKSAANAVQEGYVILDGENSELLTFAGKISLFSLQLTDENASPQRVFGREHEPLEVECMQNDITLERVNAKPIWSGCSWVPFKVSGGMPAQMTIRLCNHSKKRLYVKWSAK